MSKSYLGDILAKIALGIVVVYFLLRILLKFAPGCIEISSCIPGIVDIIAILSAGYFICRYASKIDDIRKMLKK